jgi:hypothetical protein
LSHMNSSKNVISQLNSLLKEYDDLAAGSQHDDLSDLKTESITLANRLQAAIDRLTVPTSTYARAADVQRGSATHVKLRELRGIAIALRDDVKAGWLESLIELVHADTHNDFLEMADELLGKGYKDAAAVIAGTSLEVHLRSLSAKHGVATQAPNGSPKKADTINADLKKATVYGALEQKQITSWLAVRNSAAHGQYTDYVQSDVRHLIDGVSDFAAKYPA